MNSFDVHAYCLKRMKCPNKMPSCEVVVIEWIVHHYLYNWNHWFEYWISKFIHYDIFWCNLVSIKKLFLSVMFTISGIFEWKIFFLFVKAEEWWELVGPIRGIQHLITAEKLWDVFFFNLNERLSKYKLLMINWINKIFIAIYDYAFEYSNFFKGNITV